METRLEAILKKKGIGPEGSKSLKKEDLDEITLLFKSSAESLTTKSTLLIALLILEPNEEENIWIQRVKEHPQHFLPEEIIPLISIQKSSVPLVELIKKVIAKEDLAKSECILAMNELFNDQIPEYFKGPFLEGERLKRETSEENEQFFQYLFNQSNRKYVDLPILIDISDNYDGNSRTLCLGSFVAAVLASTGVPCYIHGLDEVAPKFGVTHHQVLKAAGKHVLQSLERVSEDISNPDIGWGYIDQSIFFPSLFQLKKVRKEMVKRPFIATFEKLLQPISSNKGNYLITGYTHAHYKTEVINQLAALNNCSKAVSVKGAEGSTGVSLSKTTTGMLFDGVEIKEIQYHPSFWDLPSLEYPANKNLTAEECFREGLMALHNERNYAYWNIIYLSTLIYTSFGISDAPKAISIITEAIESGKAMRHWEKGCL